MLSIFDAVADDIRGDPRGMGRVGLLATAGTARAGLFARQALERQGIVVEPPGAPDQDAVMAAI